MTADGFDVEVMQAADSSMPYYSSWRVRGHGTISGDQGRTWVSADIYLAHTLFLRGFKALGYGFLLLFVLAGTYLLLTGPTSQTLPGFVLYLGPAGMGLVIHYAYAWREGGAAAEAQALERLLSALVATPGTAGGSSADGDIAQRPAPQAPRMAAEGSLGSPIGDRLAVLSVLAGASSFIAALVEMAGADTRSSPDPATILWQHLLVAWALAVVGVSLAALGVVRLAHSEGWLDNFSARSARLILAGALLLLVAATGPLAWVDNGWSPDDPRVQPGHIFAAVFLFGFGPCLLAAMTAGRAVFGPRNDQGTR